MATSIIKTQGNYPYTKITTNYGINAYYKKVNGVRFLIIEGNPSGQIGTGGHSFSLANTDVEAPQWFMGITKAISADNFYNITVDLNRTVQITPLGSTSAYVLATFVY